MTTLVVLAAMLFASSARADETEADRLFREGRAAMLEERFDDACPLFAESQRLDPSAGTLLNLAACHERQGRIASAWREYQEAKLLAERTQHPDRARFAEARATVLEPRLSWLRVDVHGNGLTNVLVDSHEVGRDIEIAFDAGVHIVEARGFRERIELKEGEHRLVSIEVEPTPELPPPVVVEPPPPAPPPPVVVVKKSTGGIVLQPGLFLAFVQAQSGRDDVPRLDGAGLIEGRTGRRTSCAEVSGCTIGDLDVPSTGAMGFQFFGGYAWERIAIGLRLLVGPLFSGGLLFMVGPEVSFRPVARLSLGGFLALGSWTTNGTTSFTPPIGYSPAGEGNVVEQRHGSGGAGLSIDFRLVELERGEISLTATPFFMGGSTDRVVAVPIGVGYRFR